MWRSGVLWMLVVVSAKIGENKVVGYQKSDLKGVQFNCSDSGLKSFNASLFNILYPAYNRTYYQYSIQYWPRNTINLFKPTTYQVSDLYNGTSSITALSRQRIPKLRTCKILRSATTTFHPVEGLKVFVINSTHAFVTWKRVRAPPGGNVTYRTFMRGGSDSNQTIELVCHGNKTSCIVKKDELPKSFDIYVNVHVVPGPRLQINVTAVGWDFIQLAWNSLSRYYGNVQYSVLSLSSDREDQIKTNQAEARLENLHQYTTYTIQVQAVRDGKVVVESGWKSVRTSDYDECKNNAHNCGPNSWCVNSQGSFFCNTCKTGYKSNGPNCTDYDECKENDHRCDANADCINTEGSYTCRCKEGYTGDGFNCTNYDECKENDHRCDANADCINTEGSYTCRCKEGYTGDGFNCTKVILRKCNDKKQMSSWNDPDFSHCVNKKISNVYDKLKGNTADPIAAAKQLAQLTNVDQSGPLYANDLKLVTSSLEILSREDVLDRLSGEEGASSDHTTVSDFGMSVLNISNGILDKKVLPSWNQLPEGSAATLANKLIESNDRVALLLSKNNTKDVYAEKENIVLSVRGIPVDDDLTDQLLPPTSGMREGSVFVPVSVLNHQNSSKGMRYLSFVSYKTLNEVFQTKLEDGFDVLSPIISVTLTPLSKNKFDQPVVITIKQPTDDVAGEPTCAFLNVSKSDDISWSTEGCEVGSSNDTHMQCLCYHLTSFAVLMQVKDIDAQAIKKEHHFALSLISYIGLCSSIAALFIVFLTFAFIRFLKLPRHFIHANLALSLCLAHMTFLFGINRTETKILCKALAIALHYLFLVAFTWMALEGVVLYLMLVKVFHSSMSSKKIKLIFFLCGWGVPAVIVAVSSGIYHDGYGTDRFCWLSLDRQFVWAFVAPVLAVIAFNFLCLGGTFYVMAKRGSNGNTENKVEKLRYWARSCCLLTCILGVTWLLGIFFVNKQSIFMAYLFSILNAFQGLMIFLLHCIGDRKIRAAYKNILRCNSDPHGSSSGGAKLLYKKSLRSRLGSGSDHPSDERTSDDQKHPEKQEKALLKSPCVLKQPDESKSTKKESSKSVRINEVPNSSPYASAYGGNENIELSICSKRDSFKEASKPLISETNSDTYPDSTQMKLHPQWV